MLLGRAPGKARVKTVSRQTDGQTVWEGIVHVFDLEVAMDGASMPCSTGRHPLAAGRGAGGYRGGRQWEEEMRLGLLLTILVGLAGASHISIAASSSSNRNATWAAVGKLEDGI
jgi:hypothetical protein